MAEMFKLRLSEAESSRWQQVPPCGLSSPQVAEVCVAALMEPAAENKVVEVIAESAAPAKPLAELFAGVSWM